MNRTSVLVVDDHAVVRRGLTSVISTDADFEVTGEAADIAAALRFCRSQPPDLAVVDVRLPDGDGVAFTRMLGQVAPMTRVLLLSSFSPPSTVQAALSAGAWGYLLKDSSFEQILDALRRVRTGFRVLPADVAGRLGDALAHPLTDREQTVLKTLARGGSNREIGRALGIAEATARTHVRNILSKLGVGSRAKAVAQALERGLIEPPN